MKAKLIIVAIAAAAGGYYGFGIIQKLSTFQCDIASPGAKELCRLKEIPKSLTSGGIGGAVSGAVLGMVAISLLGKKHTLPSLSPGLQNIGGLVVCGGCFAVLYLSATKQPSSVSSARVPVKINQLFNSPTSPGNIAIGAAEGNYYLQGKKLIRTRNYYGHVDPSMLGGRAVRNAGFCSNYGRGGTPKEADKGCVKRIQVRLPRLVAKLKKAGINPEKNPIALINAADLWNQASPKVSDRFASVALPQAIRKGLSVSKAVEVARVEAFRVGQRLSAGGLFNVCRDWDYSQKAKAGLIGLAPYSEEWKRRCIAWDQNRRADRIEEVVALKGLKVK